MELSEQGWLQLKQSVLGLPKIERCVSSPLKRCLKFADYFCQQSELKLEVDSNIQEMNFGDWDGRYYQELWQADDNSRSSLGKFWQNPWQFPAPNGEPIDDFTQRVTLWWQKIINEQNAQHTLVVTHGGVIKHIIAQILALSMPTTVHLSNIEVPYGSVVKIKVYHDHQQQHWPSLVL